MEAEEARQVAELERAFEQFRVLIDHQRVEAQQPLGPATVYTTLVTVWLLIYQRLHAGASLADAVHHLLETDPQLLPQNRRVREETLSGNTGAYSRARTRLKLEVAEAVAQHIFTSLMQSFPTVLSGRRMFLFDGTTIALAPTPDLKAAFPPASNQHGVSDWPIAHLLVAHELESGCALLPEVGPKFGPHAVSEAALVPALVKRLPERSIVIADRNFGIFFVVHTVLQAQHDALVRLTEARFGMLVRTASELIADEPQHRSWKVAWHASRFDRRSHPELPDAASVEVFLHEIHVHEGLTLWLATTWRCTAAEAAAFYLRRQDVETDIRTVKVLLDTENLPAKSLPMLRKELAMSIAAYNLVVHIRRLAARRAGVPARRLSFARVWSAARIMLFEPVRRTAAQWRQKFEQVLRIAGQHKLAQRPGRSYPRRAHTRRNKSTSGQREPPKTG